MKKKEIMQMVPKSVRNLIAVTMKQYPQLASDLEAIIRAHTPCVFGSDNLAEHIIALVASEQSGVDRETLRQVAFSPEAIDGGEKKMTRTTITGLTRRENGYNIVRDDGWSMWLQFAPDGYEPQVGSEIWCYTICLSIVLGVVVDGHVFRYETVAQHDAKRKAEKEKRREEERTKFPEHDAAIAKLPEIFQQRIKKFQRAPHFREDLEAYEIFVCEQAAVFAERLGTVEKLDEWRRLSWKEQTKLVPELSPDHSGNTFGMACVFAKLYLEKPEELLEAFGALAPLVGSNAYLPLEERVAED